MFECKDGVVVQIMAPPVPMWAEYENPEGDEILSMRRRGYTEPVVCLALVQKQNDPDDVDPGYLPNAEVVPLVPLHCSKHPFIPASVDEKFLGFTTIPPRKFPDSDKKE